MKTVYRFGLYDPEDKLIMETEVDEPDPRIDLDLWETFMQGNYTLMFHGEYLEPEDD